MAKPSLFYSAQEAADLYGCCYETMRKYIRLGFIPGGEKIGSRFIVRKTVFDQWLKENAA